MKGSRRQFIRGSSLAAIAAGLAPGRDAEANALLVPRYHNGWTLPRS
jgi:hypothetical protein